jgi:hypothetical protein
MFASQDRNTNFNQSKGTILKANKTDELSNSDSNVYFYYFSHLNLF